MNAAIEEHLSALAEVPSTAQSRECRAATLAAIKQAARVIGPKLMSGEVSVEGFIDRMASFGRADVLRNVADVLVCVDGQVREQLETALISRSSDRDENRGLFMRSLTRVRPNKGVFARGGWKRFDARVREIPDGLTLPAYPVASAKYYEALLPNPRYLGLFLDGVEVERGHVLNAFAYARVYICASVVIVGEVQSDNFKRLSPAARAEYRDWAMALRLAIEDFAMCVSDAKHVVSPMGVDVWRRWEVKSMNPELARVVYDQGMKRLGYQACDVGGVAWEGNIRLQRAWVRMLAPCGFDVGCS
ncbi:hypothetical protein [Archangium violaceum]|uniref:hypothetical protein n=1 Tax=Archangium violaceum TaxID=83451 RepID=UPI0036D896D4